MIERIVVPLDGSMTAEAILPQVRRLLYRQDSEILLVLAVPVPMVENSIIVAEAQLGAAREYLMGQLEKLQKQGVRVRHVLRTGSPAQVILNVAEEEKATMIALATHGATGLKRFVFGSVAETVIRRSNVPVLLVRPFWSYDLAPAKAAELRPIRNVLVPVESGDAVRAALPGIVELADLFDTRILLLRVLAGAHQRPVDHDERAGAEQELEDLGRRIEKQGVETQRLLEAGEPAERILAAVRERHVDLIAMVTHGRTGLTRWKQGSVTEEVLRQAEVPLLVIRAPQKQAKAEKKTVVKAKA